MSTTLIFILIYWLLCSQLWFMSFMWHIPSKNFICFAFLHFKMGSEMLHVACTAFFYLCNGTTWSRLMLWVTAFSFQNYIDCLAAFWITTKSESSLVFPFYGKFTFFLDACRVHSFINLHIQQILDKQLLLENADLGTAMMGGRESSAFV
jgi:hypothetical protein